jgi:flagellar basal-body rod modification protein FlgD
LKGELRGKEGEKMAVSAVSAASGNSTGLVDRATTGFSGLTSEHFLKLLITQLQNQDPLEPVGNEELLNQLSAMRTLQSNIELGEAVKSVTLQQRLSSGAAFIGKRITGTTTSGEEVAGVAERVVVRNGNTLIGVGSQEIPIENVTSVSLTAD